MNPSAELPVREVRLPFVERPWLLVHSVALFLAIGGSVLWRSFTTLPLGTEEIVGVSVAMFISLAALVAPALSLRAARKAMRRLSVEQRAVVLLRLFGTAILGPASAWLLWVALGGNGWWMQSAGDEVRAMMVSSWLLGIAGAAGLAMRYRTRPRR